MNRLSLCLLILVVSSFASYCEGKMLVAEPVGCDTGCNESLQCSYIHYAGPDEPECGITWTEGPSCHYCCNQGGQTCTGAYRMGGQTDCKIALQPETGLAFE